jgi:hypothetical protein
VLPTFTICSYTEESEEKTENNKKRNITMNSEPRQIAFVKKNYEYVRFLCHTKAFFVEALCFKSVPNKSQ